MINVAFTAPQSKDWMGGVNYHKNLFYALSTLERNDICPVLFIGRQTDPAIVELLQPHAKIVFDALFDQQGAKFKIANRIAYHLGWPVLQNRLFEKHRIDVVHHVYGPYRGLKFKTISWIPDFQHMHLPEFFTPELIRQRNTAMAKLLQISDAVIVSSQDARRDCLRFGTALEGRLHVLQFVSQPDPAVFGLERNFISGRHAIPARYFYLPNQLWKHKNHLQVFEAVKNLKASGLDVNVVCTGSLRDERNPGYIEELRTFIASNRLEENIRLLGLIDYIDVLYLIRYSVAVINPSRFEGWSSTVEECKSIGKKVIVSDLGVHREQAPAGAVFFALDDTAALEDALKSAWLENSPIPDLELEKRAAELLPGRTRDFAEGFRAVVSDILQEAPAPGDG